MRVVRAQLEASDPLQKTLACGMRQRSENLTASVSRPVQIAVGLLTAAVAGFIGLILGVNSWEWLLVPSSRELSPFAAVLVVGGCSIFIWFFGTLAYRLILNRPNREGGLFSSSFLYGAAVISLAVTLTLVLAPGRRVDRRIRAFLYGTPMSAACWLLARRRSAAARSVQL